MLCGHFLMASLHFFVGYIQLVIAGAMRSNLRRGSAGLALLLEVVIDLLPARAAGLQVFRGIAFDLRCAGGAAFDLIAQCTQA